MLEYHPVSAKDWSRLHQFGKKVSPGIFLGHALFAGTKLEKEIFWLQTLRSWKIWRRPKSTLEDSLQKDIVMPKRSEHLKFPIADGTVKLSARDYGFRKSTPTRDHPVRSRRTPSSTLRAEIPLKNIDVTRTTHTNLALLQETRIVDFWTVG